MGCDPLIDDDVLHCVADCLINLLRSCFLKSLTELTLHVVDHAFLEHFLVKSSFHVGFSSSPAVLSVTGSIRFFHSQIYGLSVDVPFLGVSSASLVRQYFVCEHIMADCVSIFI